MYLSFISFTLNQSFLFPRIWKVLYSCEAKPESPANQIGFVREKCEGKEKCRLDVGPEEFGNDQCPGMFFYNILDILF